MNTVNNTPEVLSSVPEIFGTRRNTVDDAVVALKVATEQMGVSVVEFDHNPTYNSYVNPAPKTEATNATVVYQNINTTPEAVLRQNIVAAHEKQTQIMADTQNEAKLAAVHSLAEHRAMVEQAIGGQQPKEQYDQEAA